MECTVVLSQNLGLLWENVLNSRQFSEYFGIFARPEVTGHYKKILSLYLRKYLLAIAGNLKVNEQTKYKSVPNLLFLAAWLSRESQKYGIIEFLSLRYNSEITP